MRPELSRIDPTVSSPSVLVSDLLINPLQKSEGLRCKSSDFTSLTVLPTSSPYTSRNESLHLELWVSQESRVEYILVMRVSKVLVLISRIFLRNPKDSCRLSQCTSVVPVRHFHLTVPFLFFLFYNPKCRRIDSR